MVVNGGWRKYNAGGLGTRQARVGRGRLGGRWMGPQEELLFGTLFYSSPRSPLQLSLNSPSVSPILDLIIM